MKGASISTPELIPAVVVGLGNNGMATVRSLSRKGIPVIAIYAGIDEPSEHTRYGEKILLREMSNTDALVECLVGIGKRLPGKSIVFPSGDLSLAAVSSNRDVLGKYYHLPMPSHDVVELITDKARFYSFAQENGLPVSKTFFPKSADDVEEFAERIEYPVLIKPSVATPAWRQRGLKILSANNPEELRQQYKFAFTIHQDLIVQEVTPGPDSSLYFSLTYLGADGGYRAMFTGRKLRQYVPHYGISSLAESLWNPDVDRLTRETLTALGYTGYGSVEYKRHERTGELQMTEVTGRTWYPHALSERCGINLPYIAYCDMVLGKKVEVPSRYEDHVKWIDELADVLSAYYYWKRGELSIAGWLKSYRGKRFYALAASDDPRPFFVLLKWVTKHLIYEMLQATKRLIGIGKQKSLASANPD